MIHFLVLCTGNSCRSQMAHAYLEYFCDTSKIKIYSAGIETHGLNPKAVKVLEQDGIDISHYNSNHVDQYRDIEMDYVWTVCDHAAEHCPVFPSVIKKIHIGFSDPAKAVGTEEEIIQEFINVRNQIKYSVLNLIHELELPVNYNHTKKTILPQSLATAELHQYLLGSVSPRPIAFVSTIDENGNTNLAPYSFFNAFSSNPPILVFSSNRRVEGNTTKDTLSNILKTKQCVINVVNYSIVRQMMVCSVDFPHDQSEFDFSGLTKADASQVKAPLVSESPVNLECEVTDVVTLGDQGGAGHLIICKVLCLHISQTVLDDQNRIDPHKIDLMGRMGRAFYVRASGPNVMALPQSQQLPIIGYQNLPKHILQSEILKANDLGYLAGMKSWPAISESIQKTKELNLPTVKSTEEFHKIARQYFDRRDYDTATHILNLLNS
ncbi:MAG TPA: flavin reductase [Saprospiraceae bacterium]|nr:flavin reductase [Saprospiraceae bacterium]